MDSSIISNKMQRRMNKIKRLKAKLQAEEKSFVEDFYKENDRETVRTAISLAGDYCHNFTEELVKEIQNKYEKKEKIEFDDIVVLYDVYSSVDIIRRTECTDKRENK